MGQLWKVALFEQKSARSVGVSRSEGSGTYGSEHGAETHDAASDLVLHAQRCKKKIASLSITCNAVAELEERAETGLCCAKVLQHTNDNAVAWLPDEVTLILSTTIQGFPPPWSIAFPSC